MPELSNAYAGVENAMKAQFRAAEVLKDNMPDWVEQNTIEQIDTYIDNTVTDLVTAKAIMKELAHAVKVCGLGIIYLFDHNSPI